MIKHQLKDNVINITIPKKDFSFRIPIEKIGYTSDWKIGKKETEGIVISDVSTYMLQLFTKKITDDKYIKQFQSIVKEYCPDNTINWENTLTALRLQNKYNWLITTKNKAGEKISEMEALTQLK